MKTQSLTLSYQEHDPVVERIINEKESYLKDTARKNARHFADRNLPAANDQSLNPYVGEIKTGFESLAAEITQLLKPAAHLPEGKMDIEFYKEKDKKLEAEIKAREDLNRNEMYDLGSNDSNILWARIRLTIIFVCIIGVGEIIFNSKSFQIAGENLLFALILAIAISCAITLFAHFAVFKYKEATTAAKRRMIALGSLAIATVVFIGLSILRSKYLETHGVSINPIYFVMINLFFFLVNALLSLYLLPTWKEIRDNLKKMRRARMIEKRKKEIEIINSEREKLKSDILAFSKYRIRLNFLAGYVNERIRKLYYEVVEIFKTTNLIHRTDSIVPHCFHGEVTTPDITEFHFNFPPAKQN